jgi:hypothetical protein
MPPVIRVDVEHRVSGVIWLLIDGENPVGDQLPRRRRTTDRRRVDVVAMLKMPSITELLK